MHQESKEARAVGTRRITALLEWVCPDAGGRQTGMPDEGYHPTIRWDFTLDLSYWMFAHESARIVRWTKESTNTGMADFVLAGDLDDERVSQMPWKGHLPVIGGQVLVMEGARLVAVGRVTQTDPVNRSGLV